MSSGGLSDTDLISQVQAAGGALRLADPTPEVRASFRRMISAAQRNGSIPPGQVLRHSGRDRGDLVIRLVPVEDDYTGQPEPPAVPIPGQAEDLPEQFRTLVTRTDGLGVSQSARERAVRILAGLTARLEERGCTFDLLPEPGITIRVADAGERLDFVLDEERDIVDAFADDAVLQRKYSWQRITAEPTAVWSGRLAISLDERWRRRRWRDRSRWKLEDKLPEVLAFIDEQVTEARAKARTQSSHSANK